MQAGTEAEIDDIGFFSPSMTPADELSAGEVGYLITGHQGRHEAPRRRHADHARNPAPPSRCPATATSSRWCSAASSRSTPTATRTCATRSRSCRSTTPRCSWEPETSDALGFGFRCGFLGLLHMDIVRERLEREYDLELLATMPSVEFEVTLTDGERSSRSTTRPTCPIPPASHEIREPMIDASILAPKEYIGADHGALPGAPRRAHGHALPLRRARPAHLRRCRSPRSCSTSSTSSSRAPAATPRSTTRRRARSPPTSSSSTCCSPATPVDALSMIVHRDKAYEAGRALVEKLRKKIPRQQYDVPIQAADRRERSSPARPSRPSART